jgi:hypothetical protein
MLLAVSFKMNFKDHQTNTIPNSQFTELKITVPDLAQISLKEVKIITKPQVNSQIKHFKPITTLGNKFMGEALNQLTKEQCPHKSKCEWEIHQWETYLIQVK